jgi:hypothetical protein
MIFYELARFCWAGATEPALARAYILCYSAR